MKGSFFRLPIIRCELQDELKGPVTLKLLQIVFIVHNVTVNCLLFVEADIFRAILKISL